MGTLYSREDNDQVTQWIQSDIQMPNNIQCQQIINFRKGQEKQMISNVVLMGNKYNLQQYEFSEFSEVDVENLFDKALKPFYPEYLYQVREKDKNFTLTMLVKPIEKYHLKKQDDFSQLVKFLDRIHFLNLAFRGLYEENIYHNDGRIVVVGLHSLTKKDNNKIQKIKNYSEALKMPPESIMKEQFDQAGDWWCLGALIYFSSQKELPFQNENKSMEQHLKDKTNNYRNVSFKNEIKEDEKNIILGLLNPDTIQRLQFAEKIKEDNYFEPVDWKKLQMLQSQLRLK